MKLSELKETTLHGLRWNNSPTAQQFTECLNRMLHTPVTSLITSQATARPLWSIMLFGSGLCLPHCRCQWTCSRPCHVSRLHRLRLHATHLK
ncbi:hypothetical protein RRG08_028582 [Elysia crispata]|uniref:Uncharacterized protein n=1 Tax=Elysia crispata TaxID=231223 RepID=A0AAE1DW85_9GAST|nr:hypothetical protein RRG08_028582 [Elysia crispata]